MPEPRFLIDTSICIYLLEGMSPVARDRVEALQPGEVVTSAICYAEVMRGLDPADAESVAQAEQLFSVIPALDFGVEAARRYAHLAFRRHSFDRLIAAHALALDLVLVSNNERDFADVPGLRVENWTV
ncbi:MAG: type II toxin-antitoxin system VapC family toxin [Alphaproteobacteria bacterium]